MSVLLEVLGQGLECDLRDLLRPLYWQASDVPSSTSTPGSAGLFDQGMACWLDGELETAQARFRAACSEDRRHIAARAALGCVCLEQDDLGGALQQFRVLDRLKGESAEVQLAIGLCYEKLGQAVSAVVHFSRAVAIDENSLIARQRIAAIALQANRLDETVTQYERISHLQPEETTTRTCLANLYFRAGRYDSAIQTYETAIAMEPENWALEDDKIKSLISSGQVRRAIDLTLETIDQQGPFADLYLRLANLYSIIGDDGPALDYYHRTLQMHPSYLEAVVKLATHHLLFGRWDESAEMFGQAAELNEWLLLNYLGLGVSQAAAGQTKQAIESLNLAGMIEPNSTLLLSQMIRLHRKIIQTDEIIDRLEMPQPSPLHSRAEELLRDELACHAERVQRDSGSAMARFMYGVVLRSAGKLDEAVRQFTQATQLCPTYTPALAKLGVALKDLGREEKAAKVFHRLFHPQVDQIESHYQLALKYDRPAELKAEIEARQLAQAGRAPWEIHETVALGLVHLGLADRGAARWRHLQPTHRIAS